MFWVRTPWVLKAAFPQCTWRMPAADNSLYLTFDDGPTPGVTERALEILAEHDAKATFFCLGKNAEKYPQLVQEILANGHTIGNHGFAHPNGWKVPYSAYMADIARGKAVLEDISGQEMHLFRPPYGRLTFKLYKQLAQQYAIIMWHLIGGDFAPKISQEMVLRNITRHAGPGSVVVLHDSVKCQSKMEWALTRALPVYNENGLRMKAIPNTSL